MRRILFVDDDPEVAGAVMVVFEAYALDAAGVQSRHRGDDARR
jgi:hypothetical protein